MDLKLSIKERTGRLGILGESLAEEALCRNGFSNVRNLNLDHRNHEFADLLAERDGQRYFISVKARNEFRQGGLKRNESYNFVLVPDAINRTLKLSGKPVTEITRLLLERVKWLAAQYDACPAWITIPIRANQGAYSIYFGLVESLGNKRVVPMTPKAISTYECLCDWTADSRITANLFNQL